jgi:hypothetical protein
MGQLNSAIDQVFRNKTEIEWLNAFGKLVRHVIYPEISESPIDSEDALYYVLAVNYNSFVSEGLKRGDIFQKLKEGYKTLDLHQGDKSITAAFQKIMGDDYKFTLSEHAEFNTRYGKAMIFVTGLCTIYQNGLRMISVNDEYTKEGLKNFFNYFMKTVTPVVSDVINPPNGM